MSDRVSREKFLEHVCNKQRLVFGKDGVGDVNLIWADDPKKAVNA